MEIGDMLGIAIVVFLLVLKIDYLFYTKKFKRRWGENRGRKNVTY